MCTTRAPADDDSDVWGSGSDNETSGQDELQREAAARQQRFYNVSASGSLGSVARRREGRDLAHQWPQ